MTAVPPALSEILSRAFKVPAAQLTPGSGPHTIPAWDSAGHINLVLELEKTYGIAFEEDEVAELISVETIAESLVKHGVTL